PGCPRIYPGETQELTRTPNLFGENLERKSSGGLYSSPMDWKVFHEQTKITKARPPKPDLDSATGTISLPDPPRLNMPVSEAIRARRSIRSYRRDPITLKELSALLFYSGGVTGDKQGTPLRAAPSAGARHPTEILVVAYRVEGLEPGIYRYDWLDHMLWTQAKGNLDKDLGIACLEQEFVGDCACVIVFTSKIQRTLDKYGQRGFRYAVMDAAAAAENLSLAAVALGYGTVWVGAFDDDAVSGILGLPDDELPMLLLPVGRPR
ncbi:MAG: SagB/ThcOx family dehydrogenase, partial [candidate division WOR-3 bacterium]